MPRFTTDRRLESLLHRLVSAQRPSSESSFVLVPTDALQELAELLENPVQIVDEPPALISTAELLERAQTAVAYLEDGARETAVARLRELIAAYDAATAVERVRRSATGAELILEPDTVLEAIVAGEVGDVSETTRELARFELTLRREQREWLTRAES